MRRLNIYILAFVATLSLLFTACEPTKTLFEDGDAFVSFDVMKSKSISESNANLLKIPVVIASSAGGGTVEYQISVEGIVNPAVLDTDYSIVDKSGTAITGSSLVIPAGVWSDTIYVKSIDNSVYDKDKSFVITIKSASSDLKVADFQSSYTIVITDDEHPLAKWIGSYKVDAASYFQASYDEVWNITTSAVDGEETLLNIVGIAGSENAVVASLDVANMEFTIEGEQALGDVYGYGLTSLSSYPVPSAITGTLTAEGGFESVADWVPYFTSGDYTGSAWDYFQCTFTKN